MPESGDAVRRATQQVADSLEYIERLKRELAGKNLSAEEFERALHPALSFHAQLQEELAQLEGSQQVT